MPESQLRRLAEIDRSEHITQQYVNNDGVLELRDVDVTARPWSLTGDGEHSVQARIAEWQTLLDAGGTLIGAFEGARLVGFAIYRPNLAKGMSQFAVLYITASHRRRGVGALLAREVIDLARADGATRLYVSATPTAGTVDFYRAHGFVLAAEPDPELLRLEPEDIHMVLSLGAGGGKMEDGKRGMGNGK